MGRMPVPRRVSAFTKTGCPVPASWRIIRRFHRLSARRGLVAYALRTRPPLSPIPKDRIPCDLHVLGLPPAFILSQDQTLRCNIALLLLFRLKGRLYFLPATATPKRPRLATQTREKRLLCWPHAVIELPQTSQTTSPLCRRLRVQKYNLLH